MSIATLDALHDPIDPAGGRLASSVALVTGAGRGIGRMLAGALAGEGAAVALLGRSGAALSDAVDEIQDAGGTAAAATADVTEPSSLASAIAVLEARLGPVDLLVNNAGIVGPIGPLWELDAGVWWETMEVNLRGTLLATQLVLPGMVQRRQGRIINLSSQAGVHRWPLVSGYSVSKAAVTKLTENLAQETRRHGVSVFSVHPGLLPIGMSETIAAATSETPYEAQIRRWALQQLAAGRGALPEDAVELIIRLAAGDGDRLSGRHLSVHDDLDEILARIRDIDADDHYLLRTHPLPTGISTSER